MSYLTTESGHDMFEMLSLMQKAIRRADYQHAGYAANQIKNKFRAAMWNRLCVISAEDCYGVVTKELIALRKKDEAERNDDCISQSVAILCKALKSRDACYFSCNFVLDSRCPRELHPSLKEVLEYKEVASKLDAAKKRKGAPDQYGFIQMTLDEIVSPKTDKEYAREEALAMIGANIDIAVNHLDMDMLGFNMDKLRKNERDYLWAVFFSLAKKKGIEDEIHALKDADDYVNMKKSEKDEIFISKAAILLLYASDKNIDDIMSSSYVDSNNLIDWSKYQIFPIWECKLKDGRIPEWTYDCHTLKGKKMGKTDWDMTVTEQAALTPLRKCYFDDASWLYTYEQDYRNGVMNDRQMAPIREYAKTHEVNPVKFLPYE